MKNIALGERLKLAESAARVSDNDPRLRDPAISPSVFGQGFHELWGLLLGDEPVSFEELKSRYPELTPARYNQLQSFMEKGIDEQLMERIKEGLSAYQPYQLLIDARKRASLAADDSTVATIYRSVGGEIGLRAIGFYGYDILDPALEEAAQSMRKWGIDPVNFYNPEGAP